MKYLRTHYYGDVVYLRWCDGIVSDDARSPQGGETVWIECTREVEQVTVLETVKKMMPGVKNITALYASDDYDKQAKDYCQANNVHYARADTIFGSESEVILYHSKVNTILSIQVVINMAGWFGPEYMSRARERAVIATWPR